jgi:Sigma 54 modulation/S30EA ribosomal protein C terminus/Sigma 54 modulation protein / S30EA ribosomal protein
VDVEVSAERNPRQADRRERVELTIRSRGPAIRAEAAADDRFAALDRALAKLEERLRRTSDRRKAARHGGQASRVPGPRGGPEEADGALAEIIDNGAEPDLRGSAVADPDRLDGQDYRDGADGRPSGDGVEPGGVVPIQMEGDCPVVVREKFHAAAPVSVDQALLEMELVGHDFYLFRDQQCGLPSVVYRRHGYQYGLIRLVEQTADTDMAATGRRV